MAENWVHRLYKACFACHEMVQHRRADAWLWCLLSHTQRLPAPGGFDTPMCVLAVLGLLPDGSFGLQTVAPHAWEELGWELLCFSLGFLFLFRCVFFFYIFSQLLSLPADVFL